MLSSGSLILLEGYVAGFPMRRFGGPGLYVASDCGSGKCSAVGSATAAVTAKFAQRSVLTGQAV
jgi:hypothetical protein